MNPERSPNLIGVLISCDPESEAFALEELRPLLPPRPLQWLDDGLALAQPASRFDAFAAEVARVAPIFVRHIAPVEREVVLSATEADISVLRDAAAELAGRLEPVQTFAVQTRILGEGKLPYRRVTVNETLSAHMEALTGATMDCRAPEQVVSVLCMPARGLLGVSRTEQNRSAWPGGMHRFQEAEGRISRAEHKLLEAIELFGLALPSQGTALDMGAAPGGWTHILRERGLQVVAVDPADLDPRHRRDPGIVHVRKRIQEYLKPGLAFDLLVNDMRMDAPESVAIMLQARSSLKPGGLAILTLKLPKAIKAAHHTLDTVRTALARLAQAYTVLGARQLFHNRSEVTVALQRPARA
ncbi:MAG TPA: SAM-dependent methyltransferase [Chthonomonadaceae bacterium]|nr:SAM-dependent methyltransferase [Chthonomonadaceae bacterium]